MKKLWYRFQIWASRKFGITWKATGKVEGWQFTWGGAGNQWTTISDVAYMTYWDLHTMDWTNGDTVEFYWDFEHWGGQSYYPHAFKIRKKN